MTYPSLCFRHHLLAARCTILRTVSTLSVARVAFGLVVRIEGRPHFSMKKCIFADMFHCECYATEQLKDTHDKLPLEIYIFLLVTHSCARYFICP